MTNDNNSKSQLKRLNIQKGMPLCEGCNSSRKAFEAEVRDKFKTYNLDTFNLGGPYISREARSMLWAWQAACKHKDEEIAEIQLAAIDNKDWFDALKVDFDALQSDNKRLRDALSFYADEKNWSTYHDYIGKTAHNIIMVGDQEHVSKYYFVAGIRARQALVNTSSSNGGK